MIQILIGMEAVITFDNLSVGTQLDITVGIDQ